MKIRRYLYNVSFTKGYYDLQVVIWLRFQVGLPMGGPFSCYMVKLKKNDLFINFSSYVPNLTLSRINRTPKPIS